MFSLEIGFGGFSVILNGILLFLLHSQCDCYRTTDKEGHDDEKEEDLMNWISVAKGRG